MNYRDDKLTLKFYINICPEVCLQSPLLYKIFLLKEKLEVGNLHFQMGAAWLKKQTNKQKTKTEICGSKKECPTHKS